jgi:hypothetical protein
MGAADRLRAFKLAEQYICPALQTLADDIDRGEAQGFATKGNRERGPGLSGLRASATEG